MPSHAIECECKALLLNRGLISRRARCRHGVAHRVETGARPLATAAAARMASLPNMVCNAITLSASERLPTAPCKERGGVFHSKERAISIVELAVLELGIHLVVCLRNLSVPC